VFIKANKVSRIAKKAFGKYSHMLGYTLVCSRVNVCIRARVATGCGLDDRGSRVRFPAGLGIFSSSLRPDRLWNPPSLLSNGYQGALSLGVKRQGHEADHSPPSSAEVHLCVALYLHPPIRLHAVMLC